MGMKSRISCPLCESPDFELLELPDNIQTLAQWWECQQCGSAFQNPYKSEEDQIEFYRTEYRDDDYPTLHDRVVQLMRAERQIQILKLNGLSGADYALDVGCASGVLLDEFRREWGCDVIGVELNLTDKKEAEKRNVPIVSALDDLPEDQRYDLIALSHVLEHTDYPVAFLRRLREEFATVGAALMIEVPGPPAHSSWADFHTVVFTPNTLEETLEMAGWSALKGRIMHDMAILQIVGRNEDGGDTDDNSS